MLEDEYQLDFFKYNGFVRKQCQTCGKFFWTRDLDRNTCGDAPCDPYSFIGSPVFSTEFDISQMREYYLSFFEARGHTRIKRYPVIARWRNDIYLTIASIADFQPFVTSGQVPPPANPLTISQPCIRLNDLDSVGRSGRHLTNFEMMAHHAFNKREHEIYWKEHTLELCDELLNSLKTDPLAVTYKEAPWAGGGNAGPCVEVLVNGLELATLVFMDLKTDKKGEIQIKGESYSKMDNYIVDTGYGLERFVWASKGSPTIYDALFPGIVNELMGLAGLEHELDNSEYSNILAQNARLAGLMDVSEKSNLLELRKEVASSIGMTVEKLSSIMEPVEKVYAITDHTRCLTFMLGDGVIPSNVKAGYLARLVLRRTLRMMKDLDIRVPLSDIVEMHIKHMPEYPEFRQNFAVIQDILESEEEKFNTTMERGRRIIQKMASHYKKEGEQIPLCQLTELYDSHGIPPEMAKEVASEIGVGVDLPDNFYSIIGELHNRAEEKETEVIPFADRLKHLPKTKRSFYDEPTRLEFEAVVLDVFDNNIALDSTFFYAEGGGQPSDTGTITAGYGVYKVVDVKVYDGVIVHTVGNSDGHLEISKGDITTGKVDEKRRMALARHHTATHIVNDAARKILGKHIWQAGAQKFEDHSRLDLSHYKHISPEELRQIELLANRTVMENIRVVTEWMPRTEAEQMYGFRLYQGGVPPGEKIRIVKVGDDIEACGGTHCLSTGLVGPIKMLKTERIQDGVERIEFSAGPAAVRAAQKIEFLLNDSARILNVPPEHLPISVERFFEEWKDLKKENERLKEEIARSRVYRMLGDALEIGSLKVIAEFIPGADSLELQKTATELLKHEEVVALLVSDFEGAKVVTAAGAKAINRGINAGNLVREMSKIVSGGGGGKPSLAMGGGTDPTRIQESLDCGIGLVKEMLCKETLQEACKEA
jgi:alanyl-tRNA synthetase